MGNANDTARAQIALAEWTVGDVYRGLGDAVHVNQPRLLVTMAIEPGAKALHFQRLSAKNDISKRQEPLPEPHSQPESTAERQMGFD